MKKVLFVLGAFAAMSLVACSGKSDCACDILDETGNVYVHSTDENVNGTLDVLDFDGDCKDVKWSNLPTDNNKDWASLEALNYTLKCDDK